MKKTILFILVLMCHTTFSQEKTLTGLQAFGAPFASYKQGEGLTGGLGFLLYNYGNGSTHPYNWNIYLEAKASTEGQQSYQFRLDSPKAFGSDMRLLFDTSYKNTLYEDYYGIGNTTAYHPEWMEKDNSHYISSDYYAFYTETFYLTLNMQIPLRDTHSFVVAGAGVQNRRIELYDDHPNKLAEDNPYGIQAGWSNFYRLGWVWDTRDNEAVPKKGNWSEILFQHNTSILQSDYDFQRLSIVDRRYFLLHKRLVFAQRLLAEHCFGDLPFYEMMQIYTYSESMRGLGGSSTLRGIPRMLYLGSSKLIGNFELRLELFRLTLLKQPFTVFGHLFTDAGKVWLPEDAFNFDHVHFSQGLGVHVLWKKDAVFSLDIGRSPLLDKAIYIGFGNLF